MNARQVVEPGETFTVYREQDGRLSIRCWVCLRHSFNPNDAEHRYCGFCHRFHDLMALELRIWGLKVYPQTAETVSRK